jgi:hypothetical protein
MGHPLCLRFLFLFLFLFSGIPTHVYHYGASILAAVPAIILAQVSALFIVLPVFGKGNKDPNTASEAGGGGLRGRRQLSLDSYIKRRFRSTSLNVLVAVLIFSLWTLVTVRNTIGVV